MKNIFALLFCLAILSVMVPPDYSFGSDPPTTDNQAVTHQVDAQMDLEACYCLGSLETPVASNKPLYGTELKIPGVTTFLWVPPDQRSRGHTSGTNSYYKTTLQKISLRGKGYNQVTHRFRPMLC